MATNNSIDTPLITLANTFTTAGNFPLTLTTTNTTNATFPTGSFTICPNTGSSSIATVGTVTAGTWNASIVGGTYGGTGVNNGSSTITIGGNVTYSGAFTTTFTITGNTSVTFPTSGSLSTYTGATVSGNIATFSNTTGTVQNSGYFLRIQKANYAGGAASTTITDNSITSSSVVLLNIQASTNAVSIQKVTPTANTITVLMSGDPGANTVFSYIASSAQI